MNDIGVGLVIFNSVAGDIESNLDRMSKWVIKAGQEGADVVCFPEMNISGYSIVSPDALKPETIPGPVTNWLSAMARAEKIAILAGMAEKDSMGRVYASHVLAKPDGFLWVYRKLHIPPPEQGMFLQAEEVPLFSLNGVSCGIQLCYDTHFPELSTLMALNGVEVIFSPHASPRKTPEEKYASWMRHLPARAYDNSVFVMACNQTGENGQGLIFPGISLAIGPDGKVMKKDIGGKESLLVIHLKSKDLEFVRSNRMHYFLPNRRADIYDNIMKLDELVKSPSDGFVKRPQARRPNPEE